MTSRVKHRATKTRRLSPWRVILAIVIIAGGVAVGLFSWRELRLDPLVKSDKPWSAPYVDVTATPQFSFEQLGGLNQKDAILSFIVAAPKDGCSPSWGAAYSLNEASDSLDLDRRIARLRQQGGSIAISFGGLNNDELATVCTNHSKLVGAYKKVVERYNIGTIDLDLENDNLEDLVVNARRAKAIAELQSDRRALKKPLAVWLTLPVTSVGLNKHGTDAITELLRAGVDIAGVNIMAMNYTSSEMGNRDISTVSIAALENTKRQLGILYDQAGTYLNDRSLWRKIGVTPMIGQTNNKNEVFTIGDAKRINRFAHDNGIGRVSMWSANRDVECGTNYIDKVVVSDSCSGVRQDKFDFVTALGSGFSGNIVGTADNITIGQNKPSKEDLVDNPKTSPYQIWSESDTYLQGTKVVWHHNVYQAKWWTEGDVPDNPVLQAWQTPWELIGPVLPGERPVKQAKLPSDKYPKWSGTTEYEEGQRVMFQGVPYRARWWNKGDSPAAASANSNASPWVPLTQAEINKILKDKK